uniref:uncharacterized protein LOC120328623 n=1 Tax=Styela clava TaxID=7725 RepID=UPI001939DE3A|nr:uncharacterized protein LOC120328623 [Styela clava]
MKNKIPDWFSYNNMYRSGESNTINGGIDNLYLSYGNQISVSVKSPPQSEFVTYERKFTIGDSSVNTAKTEPFIFVSAFENKDGRKDFEIQTSGFYINSKGFTSGKGSITKGNFQLDYLTPIVYSPGNTHPGLGEYFFVVHSEKYWNSVKPTELQNSIQSPFSTTVIFNGKPLNVVIGYLLLTR